MIFEAASQIAGAIAANTGLLSALSQSGTGQGMLQYSTQFGANALNDYKTMEQTKAMLKFTADRDKWLNEQQKAEQLRVEAYNSPIEQVKRLKEAGLNPMAYFGKAYETSPVDIVSTSSFPQINTNWEKPNIDNMQGFITAELNNEYLRTRNELAKEQVVSAKIQNEVAAQEAKVITGKEVGTTKQDPWYARLFTNFVRFVSRGQEGKKLPKYLTKGRVISDYNPNERMIYGEE